MRNIIFIAPPAAGKGTVSDYLVNNYNYEHLSTGDLLRDEIKSGSALGAEINEIISKGNFVSDELIMRLVEEKLGSLDINKPFILDGVPRTLKQAISLDEILDARGITDTVVIFLDIDLESATKRVLGRVICPKCKKSYNLNNEILKPMHDNLCDNCGVELERRADDTQETFKVRFDTYLESTNPVIRYYEDKEMLVKVMATKPLDEIYSLVVNAASTLTRTKEVKND